MGFIAIAGCGALGGAVAHKLATRNRIAEVRLIDPAQAMAQGKALDIQQSSPIESFTTRVTAADTWVAAAGADAIIVADDGATGTEHAGEPGLAMLRQLVQASGGAPIVFAGCHARELMGRASFELHVPRHRLIGSAPFALESALRALAGVALDGSGVEVSLRVLGAPPHAAVIAWGEATASALPLASQLPPHQVSGLTAKLRSLWPLGPYVLASAAAQVAEALLGRSRRRFSCFVALERGPRRDTIAAMPVELGWGGVTRVLDPALTAQEQTQLETAFET